MTINTSARFESYLPVYPYIPDKWEDAREILIEHMKLISNVVNSREIGYFLDEELLAGKFMYPGTTNNQELRSVFRLVIDTGGLVAGLNPPFPHGLTVDIKFTLIELWAAASNSTTFVGTEINGTGNIAAARTGLDINYDATNIYILSNGTYDRANIFIEYMTEI